MPESLWWDSIPTPGKFCKFS